MVEGGSEGSSEASLIPSSVPLRPEKEGSLVVVDAMNLPSEGCEIDADFRANKAGGAGDEEFHGKAPKAREKCSERSEVKSIGEASPVAKDDSLSEVEAIVGLADLGDGESPAHFLSTRAEALISALLS